ncbi:hypothetical protein [Nocardioides jensenii]|uniref:hypothetical protein n=1 Tax=Nocardioides jensenii TaxID=1843 RepID=UPI0008326097|nr:hypothetical protein [Nocardioides jensenii]
MQIAIPLIIVVIVLMVAVIGGLRALSKREQARQQEVKHLHEGRSLTYEVVPGQDPADVIGALEADGFHAVERGSHVLIACPGDAEHYRARIRSVIKDVPLGREGEEASRRRDVSFVDEYRDL